MKKTLILFFIAASLTAGAVYYLNFYRQKKIDVWQLVPANAILAYESNNLIDNWNRVVDKPIWETLKKMSYFHAWEDGLAKADSLSGKDGSLDKLFRNKSFITSAHRISSDDFDFLFYLDFNDKSGKTVFEKVIRSLQKDHTIISKSRIWTKQAM